MFMRIRSQTSHYKYSDLHGGQMLPPKPPSHSSQPRLKTKSDVDKATLMSRCASLKQSIGKQVQESRAE